MPALRTAQFLQPLDPRLGRHVNHDPRSRSFAIRADDDTPVTTVQHERHVPIFDQGSLGSCTGNAALGCLGTGVFFATMDADEVERWPWDQTGAVGIYSQATSIDPFDGFYPPTDTGSDGLSVAKVLTSAGLISGYEHGFDIENILRALMHRPFITGTVWTDDMFDPDDEGIVHPTGPNAGGHEYVCDGYDSDRGLVWFANSWGEEFGRNGRFAIPIEEYARLLDRDGDATFFVPSDAPAPQPVPEPDADEVLAAAVGKWARRNGACGRSKRQAIVRWMNAKGL